MRRPRARIRVAQGPRLHLHATATARVAAASADAGVEARRDSGFAISSRAAVVDAAEKVRERDAKAKENFASSSIAKFSSSASIVGPPVLEYTNFSELLKLGCLKVEVK